MGKRVKNDVFQFSFVSHPFDVFERFFEATTEFFARVFIFYMHEQDDSVFYLTGLGNALFVHGPQVEGGDRREKRDGEEERVLHPEDAAASVASKHVVN